MAREGGMARKGGPGRDGGREGGRLRGRPTEAKERQLEGWWDGGNEAGAESASFNRSPS